MVLCSNVRVRVMVRAMFLVLVRVRIRVRVRVGLRWNASKSERKVGRSRCSVPQGAEGEEVTI